RVTVPSQTPLSVRTLGRRFFQARTSGLTMAQRACTTSPVRGSITVQLLLQGQALLVRLLQGPPHRGLDEAEGVPAAEADVGVVGVRLERPGLPAAGHLAVGVGLLGV